MVKFYAIFTTLCFVGIGAMQPAFATDPCEVPTQNEEKEYSSSIVLSEVYPAPGDGEEEFIELYNDGNEPADIEGWLLADASGKTYAISADDFVSTVIDAGDYFVVPHSVSKIYLNNGDDSVYLYWPDETLQDSTSYEGAKTQMSWSLLHGKWEWSSNATEASMNEASAEDDGGNTGSEEATSENDGDEEENTAVTKQMTSTAVFLSEMLPNPTGVDTTDEWIELVNNGDEAVYLGGWQLTDESRYYTIEDITIEPGEYVVFEVGDTNISLNNSGDTLFLIDPFGTIINGTTYELSEEGASWAMKDGNWAWATTPTPGEENVLDAAQANEAAENSNGESASVGDEVSADDVDSIAIDLFRSLDDGAVASITGVVTVLPGTFGSQYFYIQDSNAGIQVYSYNKGFPDMQLGDWVQVTGEKSVARGETRIKVTAAEDMKVVDTGATILARDASTLDESLEGMLVQVEGEVVESSSSEALIDDLIKIVLKKSADIDSKLLEEGTAATVVGIIGQYDDEYRLMPRSNDDIASAADEVAFINPAEAAGAASNNPSDVEGSGAQEKSSWGQIAGVIAFIVLAVGIAGGARIRDYIKQQHKNDATTGTATSTVSPQPSIFEALKAKMHTNTPVEPKPE